MTGVEANFQGDKIASQGDKGFQLYHKLYIPRNQVNDSFQKLKILMIQDQIINAS